MEAAAAAPPSYPHKLQGKGASLRHTGSSRKRVCIRVSRLPLLTLGHSEGVRMRLEHQYVYDDSKDRSIRTTMNAQDRETKI